MSRGKLVGVVSFVSTREPAFDAGALTSFAALARLMSGVRERLDVDAVLRASDTRSRLAQEAAHIGTFEVDVASGLARVSAEHCRIYGVPEAGSIRSRRLRPWPFPRTVGSPRHRPRSGTAQPRPRWSTAFGARMTVPYAGSRGLDVSCGTTPA